MISAELLTKEFDGYKALDGVSCVIPEGCIYGMVGSNGAGKSTFLRLVSGVYRPERGTVMIDDEPVYENPDVKGRLAFVPDDLYFVYNATMRRMARFYAGVYKDFDRERFEFLTETFKLDAAKPISAFSKGMKRQAAIILAISCRPKYLFLDETFDGLDPVMRTLVKSIICRDVEERRATAILTSHSLRELEDTCDQLALLHKGGLIFESDISELKTSLFKVQVAFLDEYGRDRFKDLEVLHFAKSGSVSNLILRGDKEEVTGFLWKMNPVILDVLPLTLEEVFTYEMEALGYSFNLDAIGEGLADRREDGYEG
ncbi:MAG: ABC transporter ATP-binding protein [Butyrivibrio sp.]|nr:ABC transporter ATP-binding protein [Butyrivibrio sp.]